ncbi:MAG: hypothetical protein ACNS60_17820, partial [Candidatus Cyclobacteriaceae bacterium M2_1C_046]
MQEVKPEAEYLLYEVFRVLLSLLQVPLQEIVLFLYKLINIKHTRVLCERHLMGLKKTLMG